MLSGEPLGAREAMWRDTYRNGSAAERAEAALRLGKMLLGFGEEYGGQELLHEATESSDPGIAAAASWALAEALAAAGRSEEATKYLSRAAASADVKLAPDVLLAIGSRCAALGQLDTAVGIYRDMLRGATESQREAATVAAYRLADICRDRGQLKEAATFFLRALRDGSIALKPHAAIALAEIALEQGRCEAAAKLLRWVVETDHADLAPKAAYQLAVMYRESGDLLDAVRTLWSVAISEHSFYAPIAREELMRTIDELDASDAVEDLVDEVLGGGQLQLQPGFTHLYPKAIYPRAGCSLSAQPVPQASWGMLLIAVRWEAIAQTSSPPLQLKAGESLDGFATQA